MRPPPELREIQVSAPVGAAQSVDAPGRAYAPKERRSRKTSPTGWRRGLALATRFLATLTLVLLPLLLTAPPAWAAEGELDLTFGIARTGVFSDSDSDVSVAIQADGKIVLAGHDGAANEDFVARFDATGSLDAGFGTGGIARTGVFSSSTSGVGVTVQADGKIVLAGHDGAASEDFVARFDAYDYSLFSNGFESGGTAAWSSTVGIQQ